MAFGGGRGVVRGVGVRETARFAPRFCFVLVGASGEQRQGDSGKMLTDVNMMEGGDVGVGGWELFAGWTNVGGRPEEGNATRKV